MLTRMESYFARTARPSEDHSELNGCIEADVTIIGGGLSGLCIALDLAERGYSVAVLERHHVGWGASGRNAGFLAPGFSLSPRELVVSLGVERAKQLYSLSLAGHALMLERISTYGIDCGPIQQGALRCAMAHAPENLQRYCDFMFETFGMQMEYWSALRLRHALDTKCYADAFYNPYTYSVHGLNLTRGLARALGKNGGRIYENSEASCLTISAKQRTVRTKSGLVNSDHIVLATGGYTDEFFPPLWRATKCIYSFMMVT